MCAVGTVALSTDLPLAVRLIWSKQGLSGTCNQYPNVAVTSNDHQNWSEKVSQTKKMALIVTKLGYSIIVIDIRPCSTRCKTLLIDFIYCFFYCIASHRASHVSNEWMDNGKSNR